MLRFILQSTAIAIGSAIAGPATADDASIGSMAHVSCSGAAHEVRVTITNVEENVGQMVADLYFNDEEGFLKSSGRAQQVRFAAKAPVTSFCMVAPEPGPYAIAVYHDKNANKAFDRKAFGLPAEPFGISNDPRLVLGPPHVSEALFDVAESGANVDIRLRN